MTWTREDVLKEAVKEERFRDNRVAAMLRAYADLLERVERVANMFATSKATNARAIPSDAHEGGCWQGEDSMGDDVCAILRGDQ